MAIYTVFGKILLTVIVIREKIDILQIHRTRSRSGFQFRFSQGLRPFKTQDKINYYFNQRRFCPRSSTYYYASEVNQ